MPDINTCLWFDNQAEEAANFYVSVFPNARIGDIARCGEAGPGPAGSILTVAFELDGRRFLGLNGGPHFTFSEAISFIVDCETQAEVDMYWDKLSAGGQTQRCGWVKDRYGVSWQIVPTVLPKLMTDPAPARRNRVMQALFRMTKLDIAELQAAAEG